MGAQYRNSWPYANTLSYWSNGHTGTGASGTDQVHPSNTGHSLIANFINAGSSVNSSSSNTCIGYNSNVSADTWTNSTALGNGSTVSASNTIQLGNTSIVNVNTSGTITSNGILAPSSTITNLTTTNFTGTNASINSISGTNMNITNLQTTNFTGTNANISSLVLRGGSSQINLYPSADNGETSIRYNTTVAGGVGWVQGQGSFGVGASNFGLGGVPGLVLKADSTSGTITIPKNIFMNNQITNKMIALYDEGTSTDQTAYNFSGFGIANSTLRYQCPSGSVHRFYCNNAASTDRFSIGASVTSNVPLVATSGFSTNTFQMNTGVTTGYVLTTNNVGVGTWAAPTVGNLTGDITSVGLATTLQPLSGDITSSGRVTTAGPNLVTLNGTQILTNKTLTNVSVKGTSNQLVVYPSTDNTEASMLFKTAAVGGVEWAVGQGSYSVGNGNFGIGYGGLALQIESANRNITIPNNLITGQIIGTVIPSGTFGPMVAVPANIGTKSTGASWGTRNGGSISYTTAGSGLPVGAGILLATYTFSPAQTLAPSVVFSPAASTSTAQLIYTYIVVTNTDWKLYTNATPNASSTYVWNYQIIYRG
ncbi:MAG: hypothetical protein PHG66_04950 [Candidatus Colwellbacteria bacterium]|nr:hypothetical protein [Candidatus Colwellbacteria bacterium]